MQSSFYKKIIYAVILSSFATSPLLAAGNYSSYCSIAGKITEQFCGDKSPGNQWSSVGNDCYQLERKERCDEKLKASASGCSEMSIVFKLAKISKETFDLGMIQMAKERACSGIYASGQTIRYQNGRIAGVGGGMGWYFPNGQPATEFSFNNSMTNIFFPDGTRATHDGAGIGGRWYYPQKSDITNNAGRKGATYYRLYSGMPYNQSPSFVTPKNKIDLNLFLDYILSLNGILPN